MNIQSSYIDACQMPCLFRFKKILKAYESKKEGKDQESIQTNTTTDKILKTNL